ncbi:TIGR02300 family protein [Jiella pelagia]|uniref:TIGR02300 family protein n=1 Tax=Jiella pelagia TaxID=2986949 RepID=A0ABY7C1W5_9HYPH|nr:TIGR02300 family protein [Jiella pelagia]WAP68758.1 TIGR02300 family protein [Jiella pelagia]
MTTNERGTKRVDPESGRKFYDLGKDPIVSPYSGISYPLSYFEPPVSESSRRAAPRRPVHREEAVRTEARDDETVSLAEVEDEEEGKSELAPTDVDGDEDDESENDDRILAPDDEDDDDLSDIVDPRSDDD